MWQMALMGLGMGAKAYGEYQAARAMDEEATRQLKAAEEYIRQNVALNERLLSEQASPVATAQESEKIQKALLLANAGGARQANTAAVIQNAQNLTNREAQNVAARRNQELTQEVANQRDALAMRRRFAMLTDWIRMRIAGQKGMMWRNIGGTLMAVGNMGFASQAFRQRQEEPYWSKGEPGWSSDAGATDASRANDEYQAV